MIAPLLVCMCGIEVEVEVGGGVTVVCMHMFVMCVSNIAMMSWGLSLLHVPCSIQLDSTGAVNRYVQTPLDFALSSGKLAYYDNETITWSIPVDQATHQDWIGQFHLQFHVLMDHCGVEFRLWL